MKKVLIVFFLAISISNYGNTYYVAPYGNDSNRGDISNPFATLKKAWTVISAGDIVYLRGGIYEFSSQQYLTGKNGTSGNPIKVWAYPGEKPVFTRGPSYSYYRQCGLYFKGNYFHFKGIEITGYTQIRSDGLWSGFVAEDSNYNIFELLNSHHNGHGMRLEGNSHGNLILNSDFHHNYDPLTTGDPYGNADGLEVCYIPYGNSNTISGCRLYNNSDDGLDLSENAGFLLLENTWAWNNGFKEDGVTPGANGDGFKLGANSGSYSGILLREIRNCIAFNNRGNGFSKNDVHGVCHVYNNTAWHNAVNTTYKLGFEFNEQTTNYVHILRNNIAFGNVNPPNIQASYSNCITSNNTWNGGVTVTSNDFLSLDMYGVDGPRQADGSLPNINFLRLASGSDLIDAGVNVGIPYGGDAPDLGAFEFDLETYTPPTPVYLSSVVEKSTPSRLEITFSVILSNIIPNPSAFGVMVNSTSRSVSSVSISGAKVFLNFASSFIESDIITVAYNAPSENPLQSATGQEVASFSAKSVLNNTTRPTPVYVSSVVENATPSILEMTYSIIMANIIPATSSFIVTVNFSTRSVNSVAISGTKVLLTLSNPVANGDIVTIAYSRPTSNQLQSKDGDWASSLTAQPVTNNVTPAVPVYVNSAIAHSTPSLLEMSYNMTLSNLSIPATSAFSVLINSIPRNVTAVSISGTKVLLTLASPVVYGDVAKVSYTKPSTNPIKTVAGMEAASISAQSVSNNVLSPIPTYLSSAVENATPAKLEMTYSLNLANSVPESTAFNVRVNSVTRSVTAVSISANKVILTLASSVSYGDIITVAYTKPSTNPIKTSTGMEATSITAQPVTNRVSAILPVYVSSVIEHAAPTKLEITYSLTLANSVPAASAFAVTVNSVARAVSSVAVSGNKVILTLASAVVYGNKVTVAYTKPATNPIKTAAGGEAASITAQSVTNNVSLVNSPPVVVVSYAPTSLSGFVGELNASGSYDPNSDKLSFEWIAPANVPISATNTSIIKFLSPVVSEPKTYEFIVRISDGKATQSKAIPVQILPYKPELEEAKVTKAEASSFEYPNFPFNILDGNIGTMWSANGNNQWLLLYLKEPFKIDHIRLAFQSGMRSESYFDILGSADNETWEPVLTKSASCAFSGNLQVFGFPATKAETEYSFIKLIGHSNSANTWNYISEFKLFGFAKRSIALQEPNRVTIYPNPAHEYVNISIKETTMVPDFIRIANLSGKIVYEDKLDPEIRELQIPVSFINGLYIVQMGAGDLTLFTQKLIISN